MSSNLILKHLISLVDSLIKSPSVALPAELVVLLVTGENKVNSYSDQLKLSLEWSLKTVGMLSDQIDLNPLALACCHNSSKPVHQINVL